MERVLNDLIAAWSSHDVEKLASCFTDDCVYEDVTLGLVNRGRAELRAFVGDFFAASPDVRFELKSAFVAGNRAAAEWVMSGTHQGDMPGLPATGKRYSVRGASIMELQDGKIRRNSDYWDMATFLRQLGAMPPAEQATERR
jgi:steroid delta-isomerase-like uncharacterized protein